MKSTSLTVPCSVFAILIAADLLGVGVRPAVAEPAANDATGLVRQLGHADFAAREEATKQLASRGLQSHDALMAGLQVSDAEVRRRCQRILVHVLQADYERRIAALLSDKEGGEHDLPGWAWYREAVGNDANARKFFASMLRAEPGLFASAGQGPKQAEDAFKLRFTQIFQQMQFPNQKLRRPPSLESVASLLLVATHPDWQLPGQLADNPQLMNFARSGDFGKALNEGEHKEVARRLVGHWILVQGMPNTAHQKLRMALQYKLSAGLPLALDMLENLDAQAPNMAAWAAEAVARLGGKDYAATLLPLMDDERQCARSGEKSIEVRDVALAWLVYATGQDIEAYGQANAKNWFQTVAQNPAAMFNFSQFGYENADLRVEAMKRWSEWLEANPLPTPPKDQKSKVVARAAEANEQPEPNPAAEANSPVAGGLNMADRAMVRYLQQAERLAELREYTAAARLLGHLLSAESDFVFRPDRGVSLYRHLKPAAEHALGLFPEEGQAAYQLLFGAQSQHRFDEAVAENKQQELARVSQDYFHTQAGAEATYLLGASYWQAGQFFSAAACWQRLSKSGRRARQFEPALSLQLAACWLAMGETERIPERIEQLKAQYGDAPIELAGRQEDWFANRDEVLRWLVAVLGGEPEARDSHWGVFRGHPSRNPIAEGGSPYLVAQPLDALGKNPLLRGAIDRVRNDYFGRRRVAVPTLSPLVVDGSILLRTATHIRAVDAQSGDLLWEASPEDPLGDLLASPAAAKDEFIEELLPEDLLNRLWQNVAYGALSSDGRCAFAVEGLPLYGLIGPQRMVVDRDGMRSLDCAAFGESNLLAAYDLATGKLRWEVGGPVGGNRRRLPGTYFLGPPLPLGASLYCIADIGDQTALLVLDAATGDLQWQRVLAVREETDPQSIIRMPGFTVPRYQDLPRANGASPSYADGMLVCPIGDDQVAAVDLTTRSVAWLYEGQDDISGETIAQRRARLMQARSQTTRPPTDQWVDSCITAAEGHVLLTPPGSDRLICLRLVDGMEQWTAPRGDGVYVGGVDKGVVMVVGRSSVQGLRTNDGQPAWAAELPFPPGALPSGRGFLSHGRLYIPLSTAEVLGVEAAKGQLVSRSRSPAGIVPGNLVGLSGSVVSQSIDGVWRFDLIAEREQQAAKRIAQNDTDAAAWAERGELLLCDGRIAEAIECLTRARQLEATEQSQFRLARAVIDGLWTDYQRFRPLAESLELEGMELEQRANVLQAMGWGAQRAGDRDTALDCYLHLANIDPAGDTLEAFSAAVRVRRDRWLAARLQELLDTAGAEEESRVKQRLASLTDEARIRYMPFQPATVDAWLRSGEELAEANNRLRAELRLRAALWFAEPKERPEGIARLAGLLQEQGRPGEALPLYKRLMGPLADQRCLGDQTGRQLVEALAAESPAHPEYVAPFLWPQGKLEAATEKHDNRKPIVFHAPVRVRAVDPRLDRPANIRVENVGRALYGYDHLGRQVWEVPLKDRPPHIGFRNGYYLAEGAQLGKIVVIWLVNRVCALDLSENPPRLLWDHETTNLGGNDPRQRHHIQRANIRRMQQRQGGVIGGDTSPLIVAHGYACFERNEELVAVDLESGELLWTRDDILENTSLFGDARYIFVAPNEGTEQSQVLSALDGSDLGKRALPPLAARMTTVGRRVLAWEENPQQCQVKLIDPWSGETLWQQEMAVETRACLVGPDGIATLDPEGWFSLLRSDSGEAIVETKLEVQPKLEGMYVEPYGSNYVILANRQPEPSAQRVHIHTPIPSVNVNGSVYCVDRGGSLLWKTEVLDQQLERDLPSELPVLLFSKRRQRRVPRPQGGTTTEVEYAILSVDKRSGQTILDETLEKTHGQEMEIRAVDPKDGRIEVITRPLIVRITQAK